VTRIHRSYENGGFGEIPKPTVKVWMGEGKTNCSKMLFFDVYLLMLFFSLAKIGKGDLFVWRDFLKGGAFFLK
jgi:hypothetical protein